VTIGSINWGHVWQGFQDALGSGVSWIQTSANNIGSSISPCCSLLGTKDLIR
jgi:hypothetical protein